MKPVYHDIALAAGGSHYPEDVVNNTRMIQALDQIIKYYGG
jgi:hypothetical protein